MSKNRFYIGQKEDANEDGELEMWVADKVPSAPDGQVCGCERHDCHAIEDAYAPCKAEADSFVWRIEGDHVCYTYRCEACSENGSSDTYLADLGGNYPTTKDGYAAVPRHCA